ncbi:hypothetical protein SESBI_38635 [Sesbania bispinosa]|nr:hypothetical protein SESBI_38635 [Sesbania bispinosa]
MIMKFAGSTKWNVYDLQTRQASQFEGNHTFSGDQAMYLDEYQPAARQRQSNTCDGAGDRDGENICHNWRRTIWRCRRRRRRSRALMKRRQTGDAPENRDEPKRRGGKGSLSLFVIV